MARYKTFTALDLALQDNAESFESALKVTWSGGSVAAWRRRYIDDFLKSIVDPTLLGRMYPTYTERPTSFFYKYGLEFFCFPEKLLILIKNYCLRTFPAAWEKGEDIETTIWCLLLNYRKIRAAKMRAYIASRAMDPTHSHPVFFALAWDTSKCMGVFRSPAPIWSHNSAADLDDFMAVYDKDWQDAVKANDLQNWATILPQQWDPHHEDGLFVEDIELESYWPYH